LTTRPDVLLTHGYFLHEDAHERAVMRPYPPLGLLYLSSHLTARGFGVDVFDTTFATFEDLCAHLEATRPPVVGVYCNLMTRPRALDVVAAARERGSRVVVGGPEPASYVEEYLGHGADVVVIGEGEHTLEDLLRGSFDPDRLTAVPGIAFRAPSGEVVRTAPRAQIADLDAQPFPDRDAIDIGRYLATWREHHGVGSISLITSRGCQFRCNWCSHAVYGHTHRRRSPGNVADELAHIVATYAPETVWYADDVFTLRHAWLFEYADELDRRGLHVPFETISREDRLDERVVATLARMGCRRLWVGSESGSQRILDAMDRHTDAARVRDMVQLLQRHEIEAGMFIMLGYDGEDEDDLAATVDHLKAAAPDTFVTTVAYPIKGTPYHDRVADRVVAHRPWRDGSDRDVDSAGRHTPRYYRFATRWMVGAVAAHRERLRPRGQRDLTALARGLVNASVGRAGMRLTRRQRVAG
jgi:anaerobic magnesium-protoporphyrin IX monomethyl ester cyclase